MEAPHVVCQQAILGQITSGSTRALENGEISKSQATPSQSGFPENSIGKGLHEPKDF